MRQSTYEALIEYERGGSELSHLVLYTLAITGARFSEIANITYDDLQQPKNLIHVRCTKTKTSDRVIPILQKAKQHIINEVNKRPHNLNNYLFYTGISVISNNAVAKALHRFLLKNNIVYYTLHALRHTHASVFLKQGFPIQYISKRLGHSDIEVTLRVYSHLLNEQREKENDKLVAFLKKY